MMWYYFGLWTTLFAVIQRSRGDDQRWAGEGKVAKAGPYELGVTREDGRLHAIRIGVEGLPRELSFSIRTESDFDRLGKFLRLSKEATLDDPAFDGRAYIETTDARVIDLLRRDRRLRWALLGVMRTEYGTIRFRALRCERGQLWFDFKPSGEVEPRPSMLEKLVALLTDFREGLNAATANSPPHVDRFPARAKTLLAISTASGLAGVASYFAVVYFDFGRVLDTALLFDHAFGPSVVAFGLFVALALAMLRGDPRAHVVLFELVLVAFFGFVQTGAGIAALANRAFDGSLPARHTVALGTDDINAIPTHRRGTVYSVDPPRDQWPTALGEPLRIEIDGTTWQALTKARGMAVLAHPGALSVPWVERIDPWTPPEPSPAD